MKSLYIFILAIGISCSGLWGQSLERQVLSAIGGQFQNAQKELSFTAGQVGNQSYTGSIILNQGFQQASESGSVGIDRALQQVLDYNIYPNPVQETLKIELSSDRDLRITYKLVDVQGKSVLRSSESVGIMPSQKVQKEIDLTSLSSGTYFLVLSKDQGPIIRSFPIKKL